jgi:hypothetical protein
LGVGGQTEGRSLGRRRPSPQSTGLIIFSRAAEHELMVRIDYLRYLRLIDRQEWWQENRRLMTQQADFRLEGKQCPSS